MMEKNRNFIAIDEDLKSLWRFYIQSGIDVANRPLRETLNLGEMFFHTFDGFIRPMEIRSGFVENAAPALAEGKPDYKSIKANERDASTNAPTPVSWESVRSQVEDTISTELAAVVALKIEKAAILMALSSGERWISRDSEFCKRWSAGTVDESSVWFDPLGVSFRVGPPWAQSPKGSPTYWISIEAHTEIWLEDHDVARQNRSKLATFFQRITENFDVVKTECRSNWYEEDRLRELL